MRRRQELEVVCDSRSGELSPNDRRGAYAELQNCDSRIPQPPRNRGRESYEPTQSRPFCANEKGPHLALSSRTRKSWERQQRVAYDLFAKPQAKGRFLRKAAPQGRPRKGDAKTRQADASRSRTGAHAGRARAAGRDGEDRNAGWLRSKAFSVRKGAFDKAGVRGICNVRQRRRQRRVLT